MLKKGATTVSIVIFVFLVLMLSGAALFIFVTGSNDVVKRISDSGFIEGAYIGEETGKFILKDTLENAVIESYNKMLEENKFLNGQEQDGIKIAEGFDDSINEEFITLVNESFISGIGKKSMPDDETELKSKVSSGNYYLNLNGDNVEFNIGLVLRATRTLKDTRWAWSKGFIPIPYREEYIQEQASLIYEPDMRLYVKLNELGLETFKTIYDASKECSNQECLNLKINNFNCEIRNYDKNYNVFILISKKNFLINGEVKPIEIKFLVKKI